MRPAFNAQAIRDNMASIDRPADAEAFAKDMLEVQGIDAQRLLARPSVWERLAESMSSKRVAIASHLHDAVKSADNLKVLKVARDLQDQSVQGDLFSKVASKSVSAIDQLTKLT